MKAILGEKIGMTQMFTPEGKAVPVLRCSSDKDCRYRWL